MAKLVGVYNTSHSPFCYMAPERWNEVRFNRSLRADVPLDDIEANKVKAERVKKGFAVLREKIHEANPDVVVIFGDDQLECFDFTNFPTFAVYVGEEFQGHTSTGDAGFGRRPDPNQPPPPPEPMVTVKGHPELATSILTGMMKRGFDPAFCMDMPKPEKGLGHAFFRPSESFGILDRPIVPILVNCYYAPQATAMRCYQAGKAIREVIDAYPDDLRVAVIGSGGLWHTPGAKDGWLDEDFDRTELRYMEAGDARGMAEYFDAYVPPSDDASQAIGPRGRGATGMPGSGGPQGGTRETCNWIAAAGTAEGSKATVVDYIPLYASPIGASFAYWQNP